MNSVAWPPDFSTVDPRLGWAVLAWIFLLGIVLLSGWRGRPMGPGLVLGYVLTMFVDHFFGGAIYLAPWYGDVKTAALTADGFVESTLWLGAFIVGAVVVAPAVSGGFSRSRPESKSVDTTLLRRLPWIYAGIGMACYFILQPLLARVPSLFALVSVGWNFLVVGFGLGCWQACRDRSFSRLLLWLAATACLPFLTVTTQGFLGFGTTAALSVIAVVAIWYRPRWQVVFVGVLACYLGLSLFVTYFRDRASLRDLISSGGTLQQRVGSIVDTVTAFSLFDPTDPKHLLFIDARLNQNVLVGAALDYMEAGNAPYVMGETMWEAVEALVPRILWPDKPVAAGSGDLASRFTGLQWGPETAVGIGHVLEFYGNFGTPGVLIGGVLMGLLVAWVDRRAARRLARSDGFGFARWYLPGICLLGVGGSLVELTSGAATAVIAVFTTEGVLHAFFALRQRRKATEPVGTQRIATA